MVNQSVPGSAYKEYEKELDAFAEGLVKQLSNSIDKEMNKLKVSKEVLKSFRNEEDFQRLIGLPRQKEMMKYAEEIVKNYQKAFNKASVHLKPVFNSKSFLNSKTNFSNDQLARIAGIYNIDTKTKGNKYKPGRGNWSKEMLKVANIHDYMQSMVKEISKIDDKQFSGRLNKGKDLKLNFNDQTFESAHNILVHIQEALRAINDLSRMDGLKLSDDVLKLKDELEKKQQFVLGNIYKAIDTQFNDRFLKGGKLSHASKKVLDNAKANISKHLSDVMQKTVDSFEVEKALRTYNYRDALESSKNLKRDLTGFYNRRTDELSDHDYAQFLAKYAYANETKGKSWLKLMFSEDQIKEFESIKKRLFAGGDLSDVSGFTFQSLYEKIIKDIQEKRKAIGIFDQEIESILNQDFTSVTNEDIKTGLSNIVQDSNFTQINSELSKFVKNLAKDLTLQIADGTLTSSGAREKLARSMGKQGNFLLSQEEERKAAEAAAEAERLRIAEEARLAAEAAEAERQRREALQRLADAFRQRAEAEEQAAEEAQQQNSSSGTGGGNGSGNGGGAGSGGSGNSGNGGNGGGNNNPPNPPAPNPSNWDPLIRLVELMENGNVIARDEYRRLGTGYIEQRHLTPEVDDQGNIIGGLQERYRRTDVNFEQIERINGQFNQGLQRLLNDINSRQLKLDELIVKLSKDKSLTATELDRLTNFQDALSSLRTDVTGGTAITSMENIQAARLRLGDFDSELNEFKTVSAYLPDSAYAQANARIQETINLHQQLKKARKDLEKHPGERKYLNRVNDIENALRNAVAYVRYLRTLNGGDLFADVASSSLYTSKERQAFSGKVAKFNQAENVFAESDYDDLKSRVRTEFSAIGELANEAFFSGVDHGDLVTRFTNLWDQIEQNIANDPNIRNSSAVVDRVFGAGSADSAISAELKAVKDQILPDINKLFTQLNNKTEKFTGLLKDEKQFDVIHKLIADLQTKTNNNQFDSKDSILGFLTIIKQLTSLDDVLSTGGSLTKLFAMEDNKSNYVDQWQTKVSNIHSGLATLVNFILNGNMDDAKTEFEEFFKTVDDALSNASAYQKVTSKGELFGVGKVNNINDVTQALRYNAIQRGYVNQVSEESSTDGKSVTAVYQDQNGALIKLTGTMESAIRGYRLMSDAQRQNVGWGNALRGAINDSAKSLINMAFRSVSLWEIFQKAREGLEVFKAYDDTLTNMSYTMNATADELDSLGDACIKLANDLSISLENAESIYAIYANMQTTAEEIAAQATPTAILSNISEVDTSTAADQIQGILQQFNMLKGAEEDVAQASMHVVDVLNEISANVAIDNVKAIGIMSDAVTAAGQVAYDAGLSFEQLSAITAKVAERTREDGGTIGNAIKTIVTRISKVGKMPGYEDEVDNETLSNASASLNEVGIAVYNADGSFRELDVILTELDAKWNSLTDAQRANISYNVAATRQTSKFKNILEAWGESMSLATQATYSSGGALENQEKYLESVSGKLQKISTQWDTIWVTLYNNDGTKAILDGFSGLLNILQQIVETVGTFGTVGGIIGALFGGKVVSKKLQSQGMDIWQWFGGQKEKFSKIFDGKEAIEPLIKRFNKFDIDKIASVAELDDFNGALQDVSAAWTNLDFATQKAIYTSLDADDQFKGLIDTQFKFGDSLKKSGGETVTFGKAIKGLLGSITPTGWAIAGLTTAVAIGIGVWKAHQQAIEDAKNAAKDAASELNQSVATMESYIAEYDRLHTALKNAQNDETAMYSIKQELLVLQNSINDAFGTEYQKVNLVTGAYEDQIRVLKEYQDAATNNWYNEHTKGISGAKEEMGVRARKVKVNALDVINVRDSVLRELFDGYQDDGLQWENGYISITAEAEDAQATINSVMNKLREMKAYIDDPDAFKGLENAFSDLLGQINSAISQNADTFYKALTYEVAKSELSDEYSQFLSYAEDYQEALLQTTNPYTDENVQKLAAQINTLFTEAFANSEYKQLLEKLMGDLNLDPQTFYANNKDYLKGLYDQGLFGDMDNTDFESRANDGVTDWLDELVAKAKEAKVELPALIALLTELGYIKGQPVNNTPAPELSYVDRISQIEDLHNGLDLLAEVYKDIKEGGEFDWASILNNQDFIDQFGGLGEEYDNFIEIVSKSPDDIEACQEAFDKLATKYINADGALKNLNEETAQTSVTILKQMGIINAEEAVLDMLKRRYAQLRLEKFLLNNESIDTVSEANQLYKLAVAAGASAEALAELEMAKSMIADGEIDDANGILAKYLTDLAQFKFMVGLDFSKMEYDGSVADSAKDAYAELFDLFERRIEVLQGHLDLLEAGMENVFGADAKNTLLSHQSAIVQEEIRNYTQAAQMYDAMAQQYLGRLDEDMQTKIQNGAVDIKLIDNEELNENLSGYTEWANKAQDCRVKLEGLNAELRQIELNKFNNIVDDYTNQFDLLGQSIENIDAQIGLIEEKGEIVPESFYRQQQSLYTQQLSTLEAQRAAMENQLEASIEAGLKSGSAEWLEMVGAIDEVKGQITECKTSIEQMDNAILQLHWDEFDTIRDRFSEIASEAENLVELLNDSLDIKVSDGHGTYTDDAITALGLYAQQYEIARTNVQDYEEAINELKAAYDAGKYSTTEYYEKLSELTQGKWDAVNAAEAVEDAIMDLARSRVDEEVESINEEIDAYRKLIDAQLDAIQTEEDLRQKKEDITEASKEVSKIERQLVAMQYDTSAKANAERKLLEEQLAEAKKNLADIEHDYSIKEQQDALNKQMENFEEARNDEIKVLEESLNDREKLINEAFNLVKQNSITIGQAIETIAKGNGITVSQALVDAWSSGETAITGYSQTLTEQSSVFSQTLAGVKGEVIALQAEAEKAYGWIAKGFGAKSTELVTELQNSYTSTEALAKQAWEARTKFDRLFANFEVNGLADALSEVKDTLKDTVLLWGIFADKLDEFKKQWEDGSIVPPGLVDPFDFDFDFNDFGKDGEPSVGGPVLLNPIQLGAFAQAAVDELEDRAGEPPSPPSITTDLPFGYDWLRPGDPFRVLPRAKGGLITKDDNNPLNAIARAVGEDTIVAAKEGESVLTPVQTEAMLKLAPYLSRMNDLISSPAAIDRYKNDIITEGNKSIGNSIQVGSLVTVNGNVDDNNLKKLTEVVRKEINTTFTKWNRDFVYGGY